MYSSNEYDRRRGSDRSAAALRDQGAHARNDIILGVAGDPILIDGPSGNCVESFQPKSG